MIDTRIELTGEIDTQIELVGEVNCSMKEITPPLEDLVVIPSKEEQIFKSGSYNYGEVKVLGDEDLVASNIKQGVEIFGVTGALEELTTETKEGINNQEEIIATQESTLEEINEVIKDKILVKEKYKPRYMNQPITFQYYTGTELDHEVSMLDTTYFTKLRNTFGYCSKLTSLDLSGWNTSNVTDMYCMFFNCYELTGLDLSNFDTSNVTNMTQTFSGCRELKKLNLSSWETPKVTNMYSLFNGCTGLTELDIRNFTFDSVTNYASMFVSVPKDCLIIVKGETEKQFVLNNRNDLTNVKTVAELEG